MIDLHCHLLPQVDDGPNTIDESLAMAEKAISQGITHILCTPHHRNGRYENGKQSVMDSVASLQEELDKRHLDIQLLAGQEVRLTADIIEDLKNDNLLFIDSNCTYFLIEFPTMDILTYTKEMLFQLRSLGKIPIIVHPERNAKFRENPDLLIPYLEMGCLAQLTAPSIVGIYGKSIQKTAKEMLKRNLVQLMASDAHTVDKRTFYMKEAYEIIKKLYGEEKASLMQQVARDITLGKDITYPRYIEKRKRWGLFD